MPIDHEEINEKIERFKLEQSISMQDQLIDEAKSKVQPDTLLIQQLTRKRSGLVDSLFEVQAAIKIRQQNKVK